MAQGGSAVAVAGHFDAAHAVLAAAPPGLALQHLLHGCRLLQLAEETGGTGGCHVAGGAGCGRGRHYCSLLLLLLVLLDISWD